MNEDQSERLVQSFEKIADALGDLRVIQHRRYIRDYPEQRKPREAVITRIKTDEDLAKERQGATDEPIGKWLSTGFEEEAFVGVREREFLEEQKRDASAKAEPQAGQDATGDQAAGNKARRGRRSAGGDSPAKAG